MAFLLDKIRATTSNADFFDAMRRGVVFNDYDLPGLKTVNHVCVLGFEKAAWFGDTEGNILCLHEAIA